MKIIGLTGNSGTGKSTVAKIFSENFGYIIDADFIAHENMKRGNVAYNELVQNFGKEILSDDKEINRKKLGEIVFSDKNKLDLLNQISLKYILLEISNKVEKTVKNPSGFKYIVIDAPLLIETGLNKITDEVWVVFASYETRIDRITKRDNISAELAEKRLANQTPQSELITYADVVIENDGIELPDLSKIVLENLNL